MPRPAMNLLRNPALPFRSLHFVALLLLPVLPGFAAGSLTGMLTHATHGGPLPGAAVRLQPGGRETDLHQPARWSRSN